MLFAPIPDVVIGALFVAPFVLIVIATILLIVCRPKNQSKD